MHLPDGSACISDPPFPCQLSLGQEGLTAGTVCIHTERRLMDDGRMNWPGGDADALGGVEGKVQPHI